MTQLLLGLILFLAPHAVRIVADGWRSAMLARVGEKTWKLSYTVLSLIGLVLIVRGYAEARLTPVVLWETPRWGATVTGVLMLVSLTLLAASKMPRSRLRVNTRHPMLWGTVVWAGAHLVSNGSLADAVLFGGFLLWSVADLMSCLGRDRRDGVRMPRPTLAMTALNLAIGAVLWLAFVKGLHVMLTGVSPVPVHV